MATIQLTLGKRKFKLTPDEAKELQRQLGEVLGETPAPAPIFIPYPVYQQPSVPQWQYFNQPYCQPSTISNYYARIGGGDNYGALSSYPRHRNQ